MVRGHRVTVCRTNPAILGLVQTDLCKLEQSFSSLNHLFVLLYCTVAVCLDIEKRRFVRRLLLLQRRNSVAYVYRWLLY